MPSGSRQVGQLYKKVLLFIQHIAHFWNYQYDSLYHHRMSSSVNAPSRSALKRIKIQLIVAKRSEEREKI